MAPILLSVIPALSARGSAWTHTADVHPFGVKDGVFGVFVGREGERASGVGAGGFLNRSERESAKVHVNRSRSLLFKSP